MKALGRRVARLSAGGVIVLSLVVSAVPVGAGYDEWTRIGPLGGSIYHPTLHPTNSDLIYAPLEGKLYVSSDGGASWDLNLTCPSGVHKVFLDPVNPDTMYALTTGTLHKSTDAGGTWVQIAASVASFALDQTYPNRLFVGGGYDGVVQKSVDGGDTWVSLSTGSVNAIAAIAVDPADSAVVYAGAQGDGFFPGEGVYKSMDGGLNWARTSSGLPSTDIGMLLVDALHPDTVFAVTQSGWEYLGYGLYRSTNAGQSWSAANTGFPCTYCSIIDFDAVPGRSGEFCAILGRSAFHTDDSGEMWDPYAENVDDGLLAVEFWPPDPDLRFFGSTHGIWRVTPTAVERFGIVPIGLTAIAVDPLNTSILHAAYDIAYNSSDGGTTWGLGAEGANWEVPTAMVVNPVQTNILFVGSYNSLGGAFRSTDGGTSWDTSLADAGVNDMAIDPVSPNILYAGGLDEPFVGGLFKSIDDGLSWNKIHGSVVMDIAVNPVDPDVVYIGTSKEGIKKSTDGGTNWVSINNGLPPDLVSSGFVIAVAVNPLNPDVLYCGTTGYGIFKSTNAGDEWTAASVGLTTMDIREIVIDYLRPSILYARSYSAGVFRSVDGARNWEAMNAGLPALDMKDLVIDPASPNVLYCCSLAGLFRYVSSFDPGTEAEGGNAPPIDIRSFPNPFSDGTTVEYSVTQPSHVRLKVYDVAGREVASLVDARLGPGRYRADLRGADLGAGVYFIRATFGDRTVTRKCVLIR